MHRPWLAVCLLLGMTGITPAQSGDFRPAPPLPPDEGLVARLVSEQTGVPRKEIAVAVIIEAEAELCEGVQAKHTVQAAFVWPVLENGRRVRRVGYRTFFWNERWGWFLYRPVSIRGGEAIDICSEHKGLIQVR